MLPLTGRRPAQEPCCVWQLASLAALSAWTARPLCAHALGSKWHCLQNLRSAEWAAHAAGHVRPLRNQGQRRSGHADCFRQHCSCRNSSILGCTDRHCHAAVSRLATPVLQTDVIPSQLPRAQGPRAQQVLPCLSKYREPRVGAMANLASALAGVRYLM